MSVTHGSFSREQRWLFPVACVLAVLLVVAVFPFSSLWRQQTELDATSNAIALLQQQSANLQRQAQATSSRSAALALARQQYQLVLPGQILIQILPGAGAGASSALSGDPGFQPLVSPQNAQLGGLATPTLPTPHAGSNFLVRFFRTLEFWR